MPCSVRRVACCVWHEGHLLGALTWGVLERLSDCRVPENQGFLQGDCYRGLISLNAGVHRRRLGATVAQPNLMLDWCEALAVSQVHLTRGGSQLHLNAPLPRMPALLQLQWLCAPQLSSISSICLAPSWLLARHSFTTHAPPAQVPCITLKNTYLQSGTTLKNLYPTRWFGDEVLQSLACKSQGKLV